MRLADPTRPFPPLAVRQRSDIRFLAITRRTEQGRNVHSTHRYPAKSRPPRHIRLCARCRYRAGDLVSALVV
jgi:hypothetical protein